MKYIKTYERTEDNLIGKYVICDEIGIPNHVRDFLQNNIGQITNVKSLNNSRN